MTELNIHVHKFTEFERHNTEVVRSCECGYVEHAFNIADVENSIQYCAWTKTDFNNPKISWKPVIADNLPNYDYDYIFQKIDDFDKALELCVDLFNRRINALYWRLLRENKQNDYR